MHSATQIFAGTSLAAVLAVCQPAVAAQDSVTANPDRYVGVSNSSEILIDVLANDKLGDAAVSQLTIIGVGATSGHGSVVNFGDHLGYTPAVDFVGVDSFAYTVRAFNGSYASGQVSVKLSGVLTNWRIMLLGDSITEGEAPYNTFRRPLWHALNDAGFDIDFVGSMSGNRDGVEPNPDFDTDHEGHWGWRVDQFFESDQLAGWAQSNQPDMVVIHLGTNDLARGDSVSGTVSELGQAVSILRSTNPNIVVLIAQIIPSSRISDAQHASFNLSIADFALTTNTPESPVFAIDQADAFDGAIDTYDGSHPNPNGEQKIAAKWFDAIVSIVNEAPLLTQPIPNVAGTVGSQLSVDISGNFSDPENQALNFSAMGLPPGIRLNASSGILSGSATLSTSSIVTVTATDPYGQSADGTFAIDISNPPQATPAGGGGSFANASGLLLLVSLFLVSHCRRVSRKVVFRQLDAVGNCAR